MEGAEGLPSWRQRKQQQKKEEKKNRFVIPFSHEIPPSSDLHPAERHKLTLPARDDERGAGGGGVRREGELRRYFVPFTPQI